MSTNATYSHTEVPTRESLRRFIEAVLPTKVLDEFISEEYNNLWRIISEKSYAEKMMVLLDAESHPISTLLLIEKIKSTHPNSYNEKQAILVYRKLTIDEKTKIRGINSAIYVVSISLIGLAMFFFFKAAYQKEHPDFQNQGIPKLWNLEQWKIQCDTQTNWLDCLKYGGDVIVKDKREGCKYLWQACKINPKGCVTFEKNSESCKPYIEEDDFRNRSAEYWRVKSCKEDFAYACNRVGAVAADKAREERNEEKYTLSDASYRRTLCAYYLGCKLDEEGVLSGLPTKPDALESYQHCQSQNYVKLKINDATDWDHWYLEKQCDRNIAFSCHMLAIYLDYIKAVNLSNAKNKISAINEEYLRFDTSMLYHYACSAGIRTACSQEKELLAKNLCSNVSLPTTATFFPVFCQKENL